MKASNNKPLIPTAMLDKLHAVQRRHFRVCLGTGLFRGAAILIAAMLVAMTIDGWAVLYDPRWRRTLTLLALAAAAVGFVLGGLVPLLRKRSLASIARQIDQTHPALEERFLSLAEFAESHDSPEIRGSEAMIRKIGEQADRMSDAVAPEAVVPKASLVRAQQFLWIAAGVLVLAFVLDFSRAKILCERFWAPGADITMTQVRSKTGDIVIGKGESVTLEATTTGKKTDSANLFLRSANGRDEIVPLKRTTANSHFAYTKGSVVDSFDYRVRSGDAQTAWHRVTLAERPNLAQIKLRIISPAYSHLPVVEERSLPPRLRALAGSRLEANFQSDQPLASMGLRFSDGTTQPLAESPDHSYRFNALLTNSFAFTPVLTNRYHLDNLVKSSCEILVYPDEPPAVKVLSPSDEITARPDDLIKIDFEARDDFGIASAKLIVTVKTDPNTTPVVIPIPLQEQTGAKRMRKQIDLNLAQFHLKQDQELSYVVQVTDTKENSSAAPEGTQQNGRQIARSEGDKFSANSRGDAQKDRQTSTNNAQLSGKDAQQVEKDAQSAGNDAQQTGKASHLVEKDGKGAQSAKGAEHSTLRPDPQTHLPLAAKPSEPGSRSEGSQPPPNDMVKRVLDAGQCSSCQPMRVLVDEWGRSFEGQMREKLEIAIDPTIKLLDELLARSQELTDDTLVIGKSDQGLSQKQNPALENARGQLRQADGAVTELKSKTQDTPYAFIGLQLHEIRETHISPARQALGTVALEPPRLKEDLTHLEQASFEIKRARERLAELTRSFASVKRDYKLADAMQRLKKMHQIFLEDSEAMLGSKKPALNPQERKVAEVDDEYVEKLRKLLEEKKKIMAELAKILAEDPRMLRRFLAWQQLEGTSFRDQMTLLAHRQKSIAEGVGKWTVVEQKERTALVEQFLAAQAAEQSEVAAQAAKMHENIVAWLPLDVSADTDLITDCRNLAADISRLSTEASLKTLAETKGAGLEAAHQSLEKLRSLDGRLLQLEWSQWAGNSKLKIFAANRMTEVANLITSQSGWIKKIEALRTGDYPQAVEVDQHRLTLDTTALSEKIDATVVQVRQLSAEIGSKADQLSATMHRHILPEQSEATDALSKKAVKDAASHQTGATAAFAIGERQFDELLHLIIAKIDEAPPPTDPGQAKSLDEMLAMLQDEQKALEGLGIPCRPINVSIHKDWLKSGSNPGQQGKAQVRAVQSQARQAAEKTQKAGENATKLAQKLASGLAGPGIAGAQTGPKRGSRSWNTLVSQLGDELRQGRDNIPPEQYRQVIEQYFNTISQTIPVSTTSTNQSGR